MSSKVSSSSSSSSSKDSLNASKDECVRVVIRCRPMSSNERRNGNVKVIDMDRKLNQVRVKNPNGGDAPKTFTFDNVFDDDSSQPNIYEETARIIVDSVLQGYNGTIFAYGQTGTGKTFTMDGGESEELRGVTPRSFDQIFSHIEVSSNCQYLVRASFLEIYMEDIYDLLSERQEEKLELKENPETGVYVKGLQTNVVKSVPEINELLQSGKKNRSTGSTQMNRESSRSHSIFTIIVEASEPGPDGENHIRVGKLNLVDLAGSEKVSKTGAVGERFKEGIKINISLTSLGNVIAALTNPKTSHVPYRDSKLTRLLQDSLGGNTKTVMVANIGPADYNYEESLSTLRFANRAKSIKNKPHINEDPKDAMLREFQEEIARLKKMLADIEAGGGLPADLSALSGALGLGGGAAAAAAAALGGMGGLKAPQKIVVNKVVEKVIQKGVSKEKLKELEERAEEQRRLLEEKHQKEKEEILALKKKMEDKQSSIESELKVKESVIEAERRRKKELAEKLKAIESKLVMGNRMIDEAKKQKIMTEQNRIAIQQQKLQQEQLQQELRSKQEVHMSLAETYESAEKELQAKNVKLQKLFDKYNEMKQDIEDLQADNQREREELLETIRELTRQIHLRDTILDHFVPREETEKIYGRAAWDDEKDEWKLQQTDLPTLNAVVKRPISARLTLPIALKDSTPLSMEFRRPVTEFARLKAFLTQDANPRWRQENLIDLELDMPDRTTQDYPEFQYQLQEQQQEEAGYFQQQQYGGAAAAMMQQQQAHMAAFHMQQQQQQQAMAQQMMYAQQQRNAGTLQGAGRRMY